MWQRLAPLLRKAGHEVFTPSLTGIGERVHLASAAVGVSTHIADVLGTLEYERLTGVVLVGHSYAGMVVTGVADRAPKRVSALVYLDAFVPDDGDVAGGAMLGEDVRRVPGLGAPWLLPPPIREFDDPEVGAWVTARRTPQPIGTFTEPIRVVRPVEEYPFPRTFIKATGEPRPDPGGPFWAGADRARNSPAWRYLEIATNHMIPSNRPKELVHILLDLV